MILKYLSIISCLLLLLSCTHEADQYVLKGIDVSHYQAKINWKQIAQNQEIKFVFIKATEGNNYKDSTFQRNWSGAKSVGLKRGAYHFFRPNVSVEWQIKNFIQQVKLEKGDLPPVLDVEDVDHIPPEKLIAKVDKWLIFIEEHYGIQPIIYASLDLYQRVLQPAFPEYKGWIARYNRLAPPKNLSWQFWQYSDQAYITGIKHRVDMNVFHGNLQALEQLCLK